MKPLPRLARLLRRSSADAAASKGVTRQVRARLSKPVSSSTMRCFAVVSLSLLLLASAEKAKKEDPDDCEVCKAVINKIDSELTAKERTDVELVEKKMRSWCDDAKGKDKQMCYYMGVGDAKEGTSGGVKRDISSALTRGINGKRLCTRLKKKDGQMCELKYEKKFDPAAADWKKLRVKELRKICDDEGISTTGFTEKDEFLKAIKSHFNIKDEV